MLKRRRQSNYGHKKNPSKASAPIGVLERSLNKLKRKQLQTNELERETNDH